MLSVSRTTAGALDPVFSVLPDEFEALQRHGDTFALPDGAVQLARSDAYEQQAFVVNRAYGMQFLDAQVGTALAADWGQVPAYARSLEGLMGDGALPRLLERIAAAEAEMTRLCLLFARWLEVVVQPSGPGGAPNATAAATNSALL